MKLTDKVTRAGDLMLTSLAYLLGGSVLLLLILASIKMAWLIAVS